MDEDRLSPDMGRLIDAAKAAAAAAERPAPGDGAALGGAAAGSPPPAALAGVAAPLRSEGWAFLSAGGEVYAASAAATALAAARAPAGPAGEPVAHVPDLVAAAFAVAGESGDTLLPQGDWRPALQGVDPDLPVAVKYLGRWVVVTLGEIPPE